MTEPIVRFDRVTKAFGSKVVLDALDCSLPDGRTSVLLGPSGTGKSVFLRLVAGLLEPDSGHVYVDGSDIHALSGRELRQLRKNMGMLFQHAALFDSMTVGDNVAFPLDRHRALSPAERAERVATCLELVDMPGVEDRMPSELSGGMRKRVGLARAIVMDPRVVLLDEPNSGLDPVTARQIDELILKTQAELGSSFLIISHDIPGAFRVAHEIKMLYKGALIADGSPRALVESDHPFVREFLARALNFEVAK
jgi:phospholipid/cholesterol/gamma-HCH transport system ATP-binding protein